MAVVGRDGSLSVTCVRERIERSASTIWPRGDQIV